MPLFQGFRPVAGTICPSRAAAVVGPSRAPQGMKKGRRPRRRPRLKLSDKAGPDQCPVPGENALFPAQIAGFLAVSRPVPVYPVFLNYVVPVHEVRQDPELVQEVKSKLDNTCYSDEQLHLLTDDVIYFSCQIHRGKYWPALSDYDPGITTEKWQELLQDSNICTKECREILERIYALGAGGPGFESPHSDHLSLENRLNRRFFRVFCSVFAFWITAVQRWF